MAMIHVINGRLKVVDCFAGKRPNTKDFYFNGELCYLEIDKEETKLSIKNSITNEVLIELDIK